MGDLQIRCPRCRRHVALPTTMAGELGSCPHCGESILLPRPRFLRPWAVSGTIALIAICLSAAFVWRHFSSSKQLPQASTVQALQLRESTNPTEAASAADPEFLNLKNVATDFYNALNHQDAEAMLATMSESCRAALKAEDLKALFAGGAAFNFKALQSVKHQVTVLGEYASGSAKESVQRANGVSVDSWREFTFVKAPGGWKIFPRNEVEQAIVSGFLKSGFTDDVKTKIMLLRENDPLSSWDNNDTNALERVFPVIRGQAPVFPWDVGFVVKSSEMDGNLLFLNYAIFNISSKPWTSPLLEFDFKQDGQVVCSGNDLLPDIPPDGQCVKKTTLFLPYRLQGSTSYCLDVYSRSGPAQEAIKFTSNLPLDVKMEKAFELAKFETVGTQFDLVAGMGSSNLLCARINYRLRNISNEPIRILLVKCVWFLQNGEQLDQSTQSVVRNGDLPLEPGEYMTGFIRCGKGYNHARVPVKVDVYLEAGEQPSLVVKGMQIL